MTNHEGTARLAAQADQELPESWIPSTEEPTIVGTFIRLEQGPTVRGLAWIVVLKTEDGRERSVWLLHTVLRNELARQRPQAGELVLIKYEGKKESSAGQPYEVTGCWSIVTTRYRTGMHSPAQPETETTLPSRPTAACRSRA